MTEVESQRSSDEERTGTSTTRTYGCVTAAIVFLCFAGLSSWHFSQMLWDRLSEQQRATLSRIGVQVGIKSMRPPEAPWHGFSNTLCLVNSRGVKIKRTGYSAHRSAAGKLKDVQFVADYATLEEGLREGWLAQIEPEVGIHIDHHKMTHSHSVLAPQAGTVLRDLGQRFDAALAETISAGSQIRISSMTRTKEQQKSLVYDMKNRAATKGKSTHSYGASFDVWAIRLARDGSCAQVQSVLADQLERLRKEKRIFLVPESKCIHVTVRP